MKKFKIIDNIEDHIGYNGQDVFICKIWKDYYYDVTDEWGGVWICGEEELKEISNV